MLKQCFISFLMGIFYCISLYCGSDQTSDDFISWSRSQCKNVINKSFTSGGESFGLGLAKAMSGKFMTATGFWVTDQSAKAIARITQLEER
jgi:hypothetical protein